MATRARGKIVFLFCSAVGCGTAEKSIAKAFVSVSGACVLPSVPV